MNKRLKKKTLKDLQQASFNYYLTILLYLKELTKPINNHTFFFLYFNRVSKWAGRACGTWKMATLSSSMRVSFTRQTTSNLRWFRRGGPKGVPPMPWRQKELAAGGAATPIGTRKKKLQQPPCAIETGCWKMRAPSSSDSPHQDRAPQHLLRLRGRKGLWLGRRSAAYAMEARRSHGCHQWSSSPGRQQRSELQRPACG